LLCRVISDIINKYDIWKGKSGVAGKIKSVDTGSPAERAGVRAGETLVSVNGKKINDVLDYRFFSYDPSLTLVLADDAGKKRRVRVEKDEGEDVGLNFETYLMDSERQCSNHCLFCFVDQMPPDMRDTLYFKDDDARLSFLTGTYITLTNLSEREAQRIIDLHISPINVSVHSTDPKLRSMLLGNKAAARGIEYMRAFAESGIIMNCQIVVCPGLNDGEALKKTMRDLRDMNAATCAIVPVGLTKYRKGLYRMTPVDKARAGEIIDAVDAFGDECLKARGSRMFFCADELYIKAERPLPPEEYYEGYPQIENGVGMLRSLQGEFEDALSDIGADAPCEPFAAATGVIAAPFIAELVEAAAKKCRNADGRVYAIKNEFFGTTIDVSGLVTGSDLIKQLAGKPLGKRLLIPENMLRHGGDVFLDDVTVKDAEKALGVPVQVVGPSGYALADAIFADKEEEK
jgi:putative radical SAM enzyme (TIGR03279 family)